MLWCWRGGNFSLFFFNCYDFIIFCCFPRRTEDIGVKGYYLESVPPEWLTHFRSSVRLKGRLGAGGRLGAHWGMTVMNDSQSEDHEFQTEMPAPQLNMLSQKTIFAFHFYFLNKFLFWYKCSLAIFISWLKVQCWDCHCFLEYRPWTKIPLFFLADAFT